MKLLDLDPRWVVNRDGRLGMGLSFISPVSIARIVVWFANPIDGGEPINDRPLWHRTGDTFQTLTVSVNVNDWHGFIKCGDVSTC